MIQRIQSLYLLLVVITSAVLTTIFPLWLIKETMIMVFDLFSNEALLLKALPFLFIGSALLAVVSIFMFKNRKKQFVFNRLNILINLFLLGILLYYLLSLSGEMNISEKGIVVFLPIINVLLLVLANKAIQKDENLVKSVDRLR